MSKMKLYIDSREDSKLTSFIMEKAKKRFVPYEKKWMEVGDYVIGDVCFEAKSSQDFLQSVMNKRIWIQLDNMDKHYNKNFVIIYGSLNDAMKITKYIKSFSESSKESKKIRLSNMYYGAIGRIRLDYDAEVILCNNAKEASEQLITLAKMIPVERQIIEPSIIKRIATHDVRIDLLTTIKGVSNKKAKALLNQFECIIEIADCDISEMVEIDGIGEIIAQRIKSVLNSTKKVKQ